MKASKTLVKLVEFKLEKRIYSKISQIFKPKNDKICWGKKKSPSPSNLHLFWFK